LHLSGLTALVFRLRGPGSMKVLRRHPGYVFICWFFRYRASGINGINLVHFKAAYAYNCQYINIT
jgi:hypothetical protein